LILTENSRVGARENIQVLRKGRHTTSTNERKTETAIQKEIKNDTEI